MFCAFTAAADEQITLVAFGDSLTQGYGLPEEDGFVPQLGGWLESEGVDVQMINAGVSGDTTAGGAARIAWTLTEDIDAVIVSLGANDMLRGIDPTVSRDNLNAILAEIAARDLPVLLVGIPAASNYGPNYKQEFDSIFIDLAAKYETLHYPSFLGGLGAETLEAAQPLMQDDGIHPNAEGVARIVADIGPRVLELVERARD